MLLICYIFALGPEGRHIKNAAAAVVLTTAAAACADARGADINIFDYEVIDDTSVGEFAERFVGVFKCELDHNQDPNFVNCHIDDALKILGIGEDEMGSYSYSKLMDPHLHKYFSHLDYYRADDKGNQVEVFSHLSRVDGEPGEDLQYEDLDGAPKYDRVKPRGDNNVVELTFDFESEYAKESFTQLNEILQIEYPEYPEVFQDVKSVLYVVSYHPKPNRLVESFIFIGPDGETHLAKVNKFTKYLGDPDDYDVASYVFNGYFDDDDCVGIFGILSRVFIPDPKVYSN